MNAQSGTFPVLATRISCVSPSVDMRNGGGYLTRKHSIAGLAWIDLPAVRVSASQAHYRHGIPPACYARGRLTPSHGMNAYMRGDMERQRVTSEIKEAPLVMERAFAQRDSVIAGNASRSQCDAARGIYV